MQGLDMMAFLLMNRLNDASKNDFISKYKQLRGKLEEHELRNFFEDLIARSCPERQEHLLKAVSGYIRGITEVPEEIDPANEIEAINLTNVLTWWRETIVQNKQLEFDKKNMERDEKRLKEEVEILQRYLGGLQAPGMGSSETVKLERQMIRMISDLYWAIDEVNRMS